MLDQLREVVGIVVHVVAVPRLGRTAVATSIMSDDTIAIGREVERGAGTAVENA